MLNIQFRATRPYYFNLLPVSKIEKSLGYHFDVSIPIYVIK